MVFGTPCHLPGFVPARARGCIRNFFMFHYVGNSSLVASSSPKQDTVASKVFDDQIIAAKLNCNPLNEILTRSPRRERLLEVTGETEDAEDGRPDGPISLDMIDDDPEDDDDPTGGSGSTAEVASAISKMPDPDGALAKWVEFARKKLARHCKFVADPGPPPPPTPPSSTPSDYYYSSSSSSSSRAAPILSMP